MQVSYMLNWMVQHKITDFALNGLNSMYIIPQAVGRWTLADPQGKEPSISQWTSQHVHPILWALNSALVSNFPSPPLNTALLHHIWIFREMQGRKRRKYTAFDHSGKCRVGRGENIHAFDLVKRCYWIHHRYLSSVGLSDPAMCLSHKLYSQLPWNPTFFSSSPLNLPSPPSKPSLFHHIWIFRQQVSYMLNLMVQQILR